MSRDEILLVYDKECPACNNYCQLVRIREDVGDLKIVNARENSEVRDEITKMGLDIDQGNLCSYAYINTIYKKYVSGSGTRRFIGKKLKHILT